MSALFVDLKGFFSQFAKDRSYILDVERGNRNISRYEFGSDRAWAWYQPFGASGEELILRLCNHGSPQRGLIWRRRV